jgi:Tol biopolymer transport system component
VVLYEMVTGQRAFAGESNLAILTAILHKEPKPAGQVVKGIPHELEKIINRCLRKERDRRWQTMGDVKIALQEVKDELDSKTHVTAPAQQRDRHWKLSWYALTLALLVAGGLAVWFHRSAAKVADAPLTAVPLTSYPGEERQPSFSPDGNQVAFSWNGEKQDNFDIYIKDVGSGAQRRLTTAPEADSDPAWSPDGRSIAFLRAGSGGKSSVVLISPLGPPEHQVTEISKKETGWPKGLAWTPDGKSLVVTDRNSDNGSSALFLLSVESGEKQRLTSPPQKVFVDCQPAFSPDGRTLAFIREVAEGIRDVYLLDLSKDFRPIGESKRLTLENRLTFSPVWGLAGQDVIFSSGPFLGPNLFRIPASASGKPQRLAGVGEDGSGAAISHRTQRLVYTRELIDVNIWRLEVPGPHGTISSPMKLISSTRVDGQAQFSPDGKRIAFNSNRTGNFEIWTCESDGSNQQQLTSRAGLGGYCGSACWSPDGERIAFASILEEQWEIYVVNANGGRPKRLTTSPATDDVPSWSRDGKWIYFSSDRGGENQIWKVPTGGGEALQVTTKGGALVSLESPDAQWVYYTKNNDSLWKMPRDGGEETQVLESVHKLAFAIVNDGIYFVPRPDSAGRHSIQFFNFGTKRIRSIATIEMLISEFLSVSPDGRSILYSQADQVGSDLMLVENFR